MTLPFLSILAVTVLALVFSAIRILREYERGVVFLLGRFYRIKGPGFIIIIPFIQQWYVLIFVLLSWMYRPRM